MPSQGMRCMWKQFFDNSRDGMQPLWCTMLGEQAVTPPVESRARRDDAAGRDRAHAARGRVRRSSDAWWNVI